MKFNFEANETAKRIAKARWNSERNQILRGIIEGVTETELYDVKTEHVPGDLFLLMAYALFEGERVGILKERQRRKEFEAKKKRKALEARKGGAV